MSVNEKRAKLLLMYLQTPHTLEEIMEEFHINYMTAYRALKVLQEDEQVEETPWRVGNKKAWVALNRDVESGTLVVVLEKNKPAPLGNFVQLVTRPIEDLPGALAQVWRYSAYVGADGLEKAKAGSMTPLECKAAFREAYNYMQRLERVCEQILLMPIWDSATPKNAEQFGPVDALMAIDRAEAFERRHGR